MIIKKTLGRLGFCADTAGAELHSVTLDGKEYLWQCGDAWKRYAPILFPFICSPKNKSYRAKGKEYTLKANHGFARDMEFELAGQTDNSASFTLCSDSNTLSQYPYHFLLKVTYTLENGALTVEYRVKNTGGEDMYFYLGGHPAFICDINEGKSVIEYEKPETILQPTPNGERTVLDGEKTLALTREQFAFDVIMKDRPESGNVTLKRPDGSGVKVTFPDSDCIAVWTALDDGAQFICIEPWTSVPVYADDEYEDIENKPHAIKLGADGEYVYRYFIEVTE